MQKDWQGADGDLTAAIPQSPDRAALYVLRASARHAEGRKADARADIDAALSIDANYPEALLQRGAMKYEAGDIAGAQADWNMVIAKAPGTRAADTARKHIADTTAPPASGGQ
jgi:tetratricopeptide (TPR) repeat protein